MRLRAKWEAVTALVRKEKYAVQMCFEFIFDVWSYRIDAYCNHVASGACVGF